MGLEYDLDVAEVMSIPWPARVTKLPSGWSWGRHATHATIGCGYFLIRDRDGATLFAVMRPDLSEDEAPTEKELDAALMNRL